MAPASTRLPQPERFDAFGFDDQYYDRLIRLAARYFARRPVDVDGLHHVPAAGPALLVGDRPGLLPTLALQYAMRSLHPERRRIRPLISTEIWTSPVLGHIAMQYAGAAIGHPLNLEYLAERGWLTSTSPAGVLDYAGPEESRRDRLLRVAVREQIPVLPVASHGFAGRFAMRGTPRISIRSPIGPAQLDALPPVQLARP